MPAEHRKNKSASAGGDSTATPAATSAKATKEDTTGTTLFVSRLPYEATSTDLETFFSAIGPLRRAFVVTDPVTRFSKGVGYVNFALPEDAQAALKTLQGAKLQGGAKKAKAIRIEVAKQRDSLKDRKRKRNDPAPAAAVEEEEEEEEAHKRPKTDKESSVEDKEEAEEEEDEDEEEGEDDDDDEEDDDDEDDEDEEEEEAPKQRPALPTPSEGTTLFIRNLSYTTSEDDFRALFARFGALRYAKITMDKATGRSRGTGFVCFWNKTDADRVLEAARRVNGAAGTGSNADPLPTNGRPNPFSLASAASSSAPGLLPQGVQSVLTADPSAPLASTLTLHGRLLSILPAIERTTAEKIGSASLRERQKADKRNTYLMREGVPLPTAPLNGSCLSTISEKDKERRLDEFGRRKSQLERNPSLFVSKTRLSIRQLPLFATSKVLKRLAIYAVRMFKKEVRDGSRPDLDEDERADGTISPALALAQVADDGAPNRKARKQAERPTAVIQAKIVRQTDRIDPVTGEGRSRGYGFLEMASFQDALRVLRWANGRKEAGDLMMEYWSEELERTVQTLKKGGSKPKEGEAEKTEEDIATRITRMEKKIKELKAGIVDKAERGGGTIAIEFSVENAVVTKKRRDRVTGPRVEGAAGREGRDRSGGKFSQDSKDNRGRGRFDRGDRSSDGREGGRPEKGPQHRRENWNKKTLKGSASGSGGKPQEGANRKAVDSIKGKEKADKVLGSVIGKKRKERREKRGGN
ncbi:hypothetical protein A4X09_0g4012 [Tilletia walkeri]|uniref:RRM domain-containing protein n=1 Tax=Tilletia walkeri TaxID=117179 RepID=A0A8X7T4D5_9BASI|nr:hypothetical protein A4X09_0g4012 [Tilletia walkeri]